MTFNPTPLLLTAIALLSASGSIAESAVEGSSGCSEGYCWGSCSSEFNEYFQGDVFEIEPSHAWEEGDSWCWLTTKPSLDGQWGWVDCEEGCSLDNSDWSCGRSCSSEG